MSPFLSSYAEAVAAAQVVGSGQDFMFDTDPDALDIVGADITIDSSGAVFTIHRQGLYHVEWSLNLAPSASFALVCLNENGEPASALSNTMPGGNYTSGALFYVEEGDTPFTVSLRNFGEPVEIEEPDILTNTAGSIRILRFADGAAV